MELAQLAGIAVRRLLGLNGADSPSVALGITGGVFRHSRTVREVFCHEVRKLDPRLEVLPHLIEPVVGALQMARDGRA
jgi:hypothetical protein